MQYGRSRRNRRCEYPITFIRNDGCVWIAHTAADAVGLRVGGTHHRTVRRIYNDNGTLRNLWTSTAEWIARDAVGQIVENNDLPEKPRKTAGWWNRRLLSAQFAAERGLPIPGTGHGRGGKSLRSSGMFYGELRDNNVFDREMLDLGIHPKHVSRLRKVGPVPYEEGEWRKSQRSWKKQRRTQWKSAIGG